MEASQHRGAEISDSFISATFCPNAADLNEDVSIIDMPSLAGKRNYVAEMGSAYFFKTALESNRQLKFLLVIDKHKLVEGSCDGIINTL
jgi:hypothetical protein